LQALRGRKHALTLVKCQESLALQQHRAGHMQQVNGAGAGPISLTNSHLERRSRFAISEIRICFGLRISRSGFPLRQSHVIDEILAGRPVGQQQHPHPADLRCVRVGRNGCARRANVCQSVAGPAFNWPFQSYSFSSRWCPRRGSRVPALSPASRGTPAPLFRTSYPVSRRIPATTRTFRRRFHIQREPVSRAGFDGDGSL